MTRLLLVACLVLAVRAHAGSLLDDSAEADAPAIDLVRRATELALLDRQTGLDDIVDEARALDRERRERGLARSGVADDLALLAAGLRPTRDARRDALDAVLDEHPDDVVERLARHALEHDDDAGAAAQLLEDDAHNRRATVVNDAIRPLGIFSGAALLAAVNPFIAAGSALDSLLTTAINLYHYRDLSPREREALVRYRRQLERDPHTTAAPDIIDAAREIGTRRAKALCADSADRAKQALEQDDLDAARFFVADAARLPGCEDQNKLPEMREKLAAALAKRAARLEAARWPADDLRHPPDDEYGDYEALAGATVLADPAGMMAAAQRFTQRHPDSDWAPGATLVVGVARDMAGHRDAAAEALGSIAGDDDGPGRVAAGMLASSRFHALDGLHAAERHHARDVAEYVLVGGGPDGRTALYTASEFGAQGLQAAESFGVFNVIGMVTRAWAAWRKDPVSNQAIIDEGEQLLARDPDSPDASDVHERLATAYERAGAYDRALLHYKAVANPKTSRIKDLENEIADKLFENAKKDGGEPVLLAAIVRYYPDTDAAAKARTALEKIPRPGALPLSRDTLVAHPSLLGPSALDLEPTLLDGKLDNGELGEAGVTVSNGTLELSLRSHTGGDDYVEHRTLSAEQYTRARAAAEDALYASALAKEGTNPDVGRFEHFIPVIISGGLGDDGVSIAPAIKLRPDQSEDRPLYR
jgi:hypothetical protein